MLPFISSAASYILSLARILLTNLYNTGSQATPDCASSSSIWGSNVQQALHGCLVYFTWTNDYMLERRENVQRKECKGTLLNMGEQ